MKSTKSHAVTSLPTGTLTFLFTDIEGSTHLWEQHPEQMRAAMIRHDELIEAYIAQFSGRIVRPRGEGDSRFGVFVRASDAIAAASNIQRAFYNEPTTLHTPLRVRIGVHTGEADLREGDYYGSAVNRCARLRNVAYGGQTLISLVTYILAQDSLPASVGVRDLGEYLLKDLRRAEHIFQLVIAGLPNDFPPLKAQENFRTNLPQSLTTFIGREQELAEARQLLTLTRLLTITGPGGAGKTRLTLELANTLLSSYPEGVWLVDLSSLSDKELVIPLLAKTVGVHEEENRTLLQTLLDTLSTKTMLLILDNCEHLLPWIAQLVDRVLRGAPKLQILATSREPLGTVGEVVWSIPPLSSPRKRDAADVQRLEKFDAVKLFLERARAARSDFSLTPRNAAAIAKIAAQLEGIPLAIELAAARVKVLSTEEIADRLEACFQLLVGGSRTVAPRQQTLRALIDWSHNLLSVQEQILFRRLSVFNGGWTLQAAEAICSDGDLDAIDVLDLLTHLIDKSLVVAEPHQERYRLLEMIRQYAHEALDRSGELDDLSVRHAAHFLALAKESYTGLRGPEQADWLARLEDEHDNLRTALKWMGEHPSRASQLMEMAGALWRFWEIRGHFSEGLTWSERALAANPNAEAAQSANVLRGLGNLVRHQGDYRRAKASFEKSLSLYRQMDDKTGIADVLEMQGEILQYEGNLARSKELHDESLGLRYQIDDQVGIAASLNQLGMMARDRGDYQYARELLDESLRINRKLGDKLSTALSLNNLGLVVYLQCKYAEANNALEEAIGLYRELDDRLGISNAMHSQANVLKDQGYFKKALLLYNTALQMKQELGDKRGIARTVAGMAEVAFWQGNYPLADELIEDSLKLSRELGVKRSIVNALVVKAYNAHYQGDFAQAAGLATESLALGSEIEAPRATAFSKEVFGLGAYARGDLDEATSYFREALELFRKVEDPHNVGNVLVNLARTAYRQGDFARAKSYLEESLSTSYELDTRWSLAFSLEIMGLVKRNEGSCGQALSLFQESLALSAEQDNQQGIANCVGAIAGLAIIGGDPRRAARLFAMAERLRQAMGARMGHDDQAEYEGYLKQLRDQLETTGFDEAWSEGRRMTVEQVIDDVRAWSASSPFKS